MIEKSIDLPCQFWTSSLSIPNSSNNKSFGNVQFDEYEGIKVTIYGNHSVSQKKSLKVLYGGTKRPSTQYLSLYNGIRTSYGISGEKATVVMANELQQPGPHEILLDEKAFAGKGTYILEVYVDDKVLSQHRIIKE